MSSVSVFGGTGYAGGHIAREAARRGHRVTSYTRSLPADPAPGVTYRRGSVYDPAVVADAAKADVVVLALHALSPGQQPLINALPEVIEICEATGARLGVVGGAGSSLVAEGGPRLVDTPEFHEDWKPEALALAAVLDELRASGPKLDWFFVTPPALFGAYAPGEALGTYRTGGDVLVTKDDGSSEISGEDYALAFVDEIERRAHVRQRFTVGH